MSDASILDKLGVTEWLKENVESVLNAPWISDAPFAEFKRDASHVDLGITGCQVAVAETGTLILTNAERNRLMSLLPPIHVVVFTPSELVGDAGQALERARTDMNPSIITMITGPSRTADIEMTLTAGVHGPREVHALLIEDAA